MTPEQQAAYVIAQAMCMMVEALGMQAQNQARIAEGEAPVFLKEQFDALITQYGVHHNGTIGLFTGRR
jgi:hypothetical protein